MVSRVLCLFWGFNGILVILKLSMGIVVVLRVFWSFFRVLRYFGYSWCILVILSVQRGYLVFLVYLLVFVIFVIPSGKIIFSPKKYPRNHLNGHYSPKIAKISKNRKMSKKKLTRNLLIDQNSFKSSKMTKITQNPPKWPKYP